MAKASPFRLLLFFLIVILFLAGGIVLSSNRNPNNENDTNVRTQINVTPTNTPEATGKAYVIYANTIQNGTQILAQNNNTADPKILALLPGDIKHVNITPSGDMIYIAQVNKQDHGKRIEIYKAKTKKTETLAEHTEDFGIDDVLVSPDGSTIAWWEVNLKGGALLGGQSKVFVQKINSDSQNPILITDETSTRTTPIHYPLFFDYLGRLYLDSFIPNQGDGFYLGMSVYNPALNSTALTPVPGMGVGSYTSDPELSPTGDRIVYVASDKTQITEALSNPNQIGVLDLRSYTKSTVLDGGTLRMFMNPKWTDDGQKIVYQAYTIFSPTESQYDGILVLDLLTNTETTLAIENTEKNTILLGTKNNVVLWGEGSTEIGNLGRKYSQILSSVYETDLTTDATVNILAEPYIQYIASATSIGNVVGKLTFMDTLQLASFVPKVVAKERKIQQNEPTPTPRPTGPTTTPYPTRDPSTPAPLCREVCNIDDLRYNPAAWIKCAVAAKCYDSPLYLYPEKTQEITIQVKDAQVFSEVPKSKNGVWTVTADPNGTMSVDGKKYDKISYGYFGKNVPPPKDGVIVEEKKLKENLTEIGTKLGLNSRELTDFTSFWISNLPKSPYYFLSFYSKDESEKIVSYTFDPPPDTFLQIIMYFKPIKKPVSVNPPKYPQVSRTGSVYVDWSGIIDK